MSEELKKWPPSQHAFEQMKKDGVAQYGSVIKWDYICEMFGIDDREGWPFRTEWFKLRELFEEDGFLLTEKDQNEEGFRFLDRLEMADAVKCREIKKANDSLRKSITLSKVPREKLAESEVKKLDHWEAKAALIGATSKVLLRKRSLPSPEMAIKSVNHYLKDASSE